METMLKITFLGDVTCDRPLLQAARKDGGFDFTPAFSRMKSFLADSDFTIANLETNCAGSKNNYKNEFFVCNSPDELIKAIKDAGIDYLTTANNHCLDKGLKGMKRTLTVLDSCGLGHTGTFADKELSERPSIIELDGIRIAVLSYTYSVNAGNTGNILNQNNEWQVGLLRNPSVSEGAAKKLFHKLPLPFTRMVRRVIARTKKIVKKSYFKPFTDSIKPNDTDNRYLDRIKADIKMAKEAADIVVVCPHMGGQFNETPGPYSEFLVSFLREAGADVVAANHPHVVQKVIKEDDFTAAYSIGSLNLSPSADYIIKSPLPEYSMAYNIYIDRSNRKVARATFSLLKIIEDENKMITVYPVAELKDSETVSDVLRLVKRITGRETPESEIVAEYEL